MPQGKLKQKTKVPNNVKQKQKGKAFTTRSREWKIWLFYRSVKVKVENLSLGAPIQPKKHKFAEQQKLKQIVSKSVNKSVEEEMRKRAKEGQINLSKAQQAVAKYHKEKIETTKEEKSTDETMD